MFSAIWWTYFVVALIQGVLANIKEEFDMTTVEILKKYGFSVEIYSNVTTEDGYLLDIYRIPHGRFGKPKGPQIPVLLMHGLWRTSEDYIVTTEKSLTFLLADRGYDVWLPNARGSPHSRKHLTLNPDVDATYWKYGWHEIGIYDLPAIFKLIRDVTKMERLSYIGISEGTTYFYVLASVKPEYNQNVTVMISLGPTAFMAHTNPILKIASAFEPILTSYAKRLRIYEGKQITELLRVANRVFCTQEGFLQNLCTNILYLIAGFDPEQTDVSFIPSAVKNGVNGAIRQFLHQMQTINSGEFRQFDFGCKVNLKKYGTPQPPSYNLSQITAPVALFYSDGDQLVTVPDVERLCVELGNCAYKYKVPWKELNHFDFVFAKDVVDLVYKEVFYVLEKFNKI